MKKSIHRTVYGIFTANPDKIFTTRELQMICREKHGMETHKRIITTILARLHRKKLILRTPTQLAEGHHYSSNNKEALNILYERHLLPYQFDNKRYLIENIQKKEFETLGTNISLELDLIKDQPFVKKYSKDLFESLKTWQYLASLVGFAMCDGNITQNLTKTRFFFRRKNDAEKFINDFKRVFNKESGLLRHSTVGESFVVTICKSAEISKLLNNLGAPAGNKTTRSFLIPDWIYRGPDEIKKAFLSTVIGNEGSAPSNRKWRIQFVLSKSEEHVANLVDFLNQIRSMLNHFGISTSHIQLRKQPGRQFCGRFYIKGRENLHKFYKRFEFSYASEKQEVLEDLMRTKPLRSAVCDDLVNTR
ncbi:MAG: hypothetical protein KKD17_01280 [Nanoarchaeota archaeon]|nr:hypothetical protein [Nanoarchaeota archaeon]